MPPSKKMPKLGARQIARHLKDIPDWSLHGLRIRRRFEFKGFMDSVGFVRRVAREAEKANHHPDIDIRWNKVTLTLTTHDSGGLTRLDFSMARCFDSVC